MKKLLLVLFCVTILFKTKAQVVFCPPEAQWRYEFSVSMFEPFTRVNEKIFYQKDSIQGTDTFKVLSHIRFYKRCNNSVSSPTLLRQIGDTIYFKNNRTQGTWQILYNFACSVGQSWETTIKQGNVTIKTYTYTVDSVYYVTENGFSLKRLRVIDSFYGTIYITERFGCSDFLFNYYNTSCDADVFQDFLCYSDNAFGTKMFTAKPCNFSNPTGLNDLSAANDTFIFPNPANDSFILKTELTGDLVLRLTDVFGREIKNIRIESEKTLGINDLERGIYFISVSSENELIYKTKLIKE